MMYDELIKRLRRCEQFRCRECEYENVMGCRTKLNAEAADAIEYLQKQLREEKVDNVNLTGWLAEEHAKHLWIPVTERLPEERGNYLVVINCPRGRWDEICAFDGEEEWVHIDEYAEIATKWVTHWMPLPKPPESEGE